MIVRKMLPGNNELVNYTYYCAWQTVKGKNYRIGCKPPRVNREEENSRADLSVFPGT